MFCLLYRGFEIEFVEACALLNFDIGFFLWMFLGGGVLMGKYLDGVLNVVEGCLVKYVKYGFY